MPAWPPIICTLLEAYWTTVFERLEWSWKCIDLAFIHFISMHSSTVIHSVCGRPKCLTACDWVIKWCVTRCACYSSPSLMVMGCFVDLRPMAGTLGREPLGGYTHKTLWTSALVQEVTCVPCVRLKCPHMFDHPVWLSNDFLLVLGFHLNTKSVYNREFTYFDVQANISCTAMANQMHWLIYDISD